MTFGLKKIKIVIKNFQIKFLPHLKNLKNSSLFNLHINRNLILFLIMVSYLYLSIIVDLMMKT